MKIFVNPKPQRGTFNGIEVSADDITPETTNPVIVLREPGDSDAEYERLVMQIEDQMLTEADRLIANLGTPSTFDYLEALFSFDGGFAEFRTVPPRVDPALYVPLDTLDHSAIRELAKRYNVDQRVNLYVGMASRRDASSGARANCHKLGALFADIDFKSEQHKDGVTEADGRAALAAFPVPPSAVIHTGGGLNAAWLLKTPVDLDNENEAHFVRCMLKALARALNADPSVAELARVLRVPGSVNYKYSPARLAVLERLNVERRYDLDDFTHALAPFMADDAEQLDRSAVISHGLTVEQRIARARAYFRRLPGAIQGELGDNRTFSAAAHAVRGFDLPDDAALDLLLEWNETCAPPWTKAELIAKIANAHKSGSGPRGSMFAGEEIAVLTDDAVIEDMSLPVDVEPYAFAPAFPAGHFVSDYIAYASQQTDAAHEYLEAMALALLATVTSNLRAYFGPWPNGLTTCLYLLLIGDSTLSRKSTAKDQARDIAKRVNETQLMPEKMTPEAFVEQLAHRSPGSSLWTADEFGPLLVEMHRRDHMKGLAGYLLSAYSGDDVTYSRVAKKGQPDDLIARQPHLTLIGCVTPLIFDQMHTTDVESGFLPRFGVIMPGRKPERKPFYTMQGDLGAERNALVKWLAQIRATTPINVIGQSNGTPADRRVTFSHASLRRLDDYAKGLEARGASNLMLVRLNTMLLKVAMLCAAGRPDAAGDLCVSVDDADVAIRVIQRWEGFAVEFAARMGANEHERKIAKCMAFMAGRKGFVERSAVLKHVRTDARDFANVEQSLVERGLIEVSTVKVVKQGTKVRKLWKLSES